MDPSAPGIPATGPWDLALASSAPNLTEVCFSLGGCSMFEPHEQLATLAPLAQLNTIVLDCEEAYELSEPEQLLRPEGILLPSSVTKLVLCNFDRCVPAVALPENVAVVHMLCIKPLCDATSH